VECTALKRAMEVVYAATLPKASKPFIYMAITLPPEHVDVNVHPTKKEVIFLTFMNKNCKTDGLENSDSWNLEILLFHYCGNCGRCECWR